MEYGLIITYGLLAMVAIWGHRLKMKDIELRLNALERAQKGTLPPEPNVIWRPTQGGDDAEER